MPVTTVMPEVVEETCILCDEDINVVILPCQHAVLCEVHAKGARKCPQCKETVESVQAIFNRKVELCLLCDKTVTVLLKPCDHIVLCKEHGKTAKKCPMCREKITALKQLCVGCLRVEGTVTLKPCDHMTCQGWTALLHPYYLPYSKIGHESVEQLYVNLIVLSNH